MKDICIIYCIIVYASVPTKVYCNQQKCLIFVCNQFSDAGNIDGFDHTCGRVSTIYHVLCVYAPPDHVKKNVGMFKFFGKDEFIQDRYCSQ